MAFGTDGFKVVDWDKQINKRFSLPKHIKSDWDILFKKINWEDEKVIETCNNFWNTTYKQIKDILHNEYIPLSLLKEISSINKT